MLVWTNILADLYIALAFYSSFMDKYTVNGLRLQANVA